MSFSSSAGKPVPPANPHEEIRKNTFITLIYFGPITENSIILWCIFAVRIWSLATETYIYYPAIGELY
jgi:hypothetical protein